MAKIGLKLLALGVAAACAGGTAVAQDGLQRFERELKPQFGFKQFTYDSASALGDKGFVLNGVTIVVPANGATGGKDSTVKVEKVTVEEADFDRLKDAGQKDDVPRFIKLRIDGLSGDDTLSSMLEPYGVPRVPADLALDYRLDPATKVLTLNKLELSLREQAKLGLSLVLEGMSDKTSGAMAAKDDARLRTAVLVLDDVGLLAKLLPALAKQQNAPPEALVAMAMVPLAGFASKQSGDTLKALDALVSFLGDWKKPQGPIKITIAPAKGASFDDLGKIEQPNALAEVFGLKIEYAGTRSGAAGGAPSDKGTPAAPAGGTTTGAEAWLSLIGNTVTGKIDGDVIFEYYRKDGTLTLMEGSELTKGSWSLEGEKVCFKYPDEDKDCQTLSRTGDEVTFTRDKKNGYRLKVLPGNPKNL